VCQNQGDCDTLPGTVCQAVGICSITGAACSTNLPCRDITEQCVTIPEVCVNRTLCTAADYAGTAVPISEESNRATAIIRSLAAQVPEASSLTPTGPALAGALQQSRQWASTHPGRQVVTVLATDGFPTVCEPRDIPDIAQVAGAAFSADPSVKTFVVGVFSRADLGDSGVQRLNTVAAAGGTDRAFIVSTEGDVAASFLAALNRIRDTTLACQFQLDGSLGLDFDRVNMTYTAPDGAVTALSSVSTREGCVATPSGWYYERDDSGTPVRIEMCPQTCEQLQVSNSRAELQIGCATRLR
jgi:hypothetical protein